MASSRTVVSESDEDSEGSFEFSDEEGDVFDSDDEDDTGFGGDFDEDEDEDGFGEAEEDEDDEEESTGFADDGGDDEEAPAPTPSVGAWDKYAAKNLAEGCTNHYEHPGLTKVWSKPVTTITGPIQIVQAKISYKWLLNFMGDSPSDPKNEKSVIEKVGLLCKEGIKDANMAKELYCQLLKQLHKNSSKLSHAKGFILLNLYLGNFMPPADIFTSIDEAICNGPPIFKQFSQKRFAMLQSKNENRVFPPLRIELLAIKKREQVPLKVTFWGKETLNIEVHSVTTTAELTAMVANELDLNSAEGFGLRIRAGAAISGVGSGKHYILDALNDLDSKLGQGKWKLEFTKQEFAPWHSRLEGHGLDIASGQIAAALRGGRYRLSDVDSYVHVASLMLHMQHGENLISGSELESYISTILPNFLIDGMVKMEKKASVKRKRMVHKAAVWAEKIEKYHARLDVSKNNAPKDVAQYKMIEHVSNQWPAFFSSYFAAKMVSQEEDFDAVTLAINEKGIYFITANTVTPFKGFPWSKVQNVSRSPRGNFDFKVDTDGDDRGRSYSFTLNNQDSIMGAVVKQAQRLKQNASD